MIPAPPLSSVALKGRYVFLDNDFLGSIFSDPELFSASITILGAEGNLVIDGFTRLEFIREVWVPEIRAKKEQFLDSDWFSPMIEHQEFFSQIKEKAQELSRLYAYKNPTNKKAPSIVDLLLAGTLMFYKNSVLVTGNKKDFPSSIFDTIGVMNFEQADGGMRAISVVSFSQHKYEACRDSYEKVLAKKVENKGV